MKFDRAAAKQQGWSDAEIDNYLGTMTHGKLADLMKLPPAPSRSPRIAAHIGYGGDFARAGLASLPGVLGTAGTVLGAGGGGLLATPSDVVLGPLGTISGATIGGMRGGMAGTALGEWLRQAGMRAMGADPPLTTANVAGSIARIAGEGVLGGLMAAPAVGGVRAIRNPESLSRNLVRDIPGIGKFVRTVERVRGWEPPPEVARGATSEIGGWENLGKAGTRAAARTTQASVRAAASGSEASAAPIVKASARTAAKTVAQKVAPQEVLPAREWAEGPVIRAWRTGKQLPGPVRGGTQVMPGGVTGQIGAERALVNAGFTPGERMIARKLIRAGVPLAQILRLIKAAPK